METMGIEINKQELWKIAMYHTLPNGEFCDVFGHFASAYAPAKKLNEESL